MLATILKRQLGKTEICVSEIGVGGAQFGNLYQSMSDQEASDIMAFWYKQGVTLFDTAPFYGFGLSEKRVGEFINQNGLHGDIVLSTKAGRLLNPSSVADESVCRDGFYSSFPFKAKFDYSYSGIMRSFFDSQKRMQNRSTDILLIHDIGKMAHPQHHEVYWQQLLHGGLQALRELKQAGDIRAFGLGVNEVEVCHKLLDVCEPDCLLLAGRYTLLEQSPIHDLLPRCVNQGVSIMAGGIYNSGILASFASETKQTSTSKSLAFYNYQPAPEAIKKKTFALQSVCLRYEVPLAAAALQFVLAHPAICSVLSGSGSMSQAQQTLDYYHWHIPEEFWHELKLQGLVDEIAPIPTPNVSVSSGWMS